jgi:hypothetical protein
MLPSIGRFRPSASSHHDLFSAVFTTNTPGIEFSAQTGAARPASLSESSLFLLRKNRVPVILVSFGNRFLALTPAIAGG